MRQWRLDIAKWPGPDRTKWPGLRDIVVEIPDGRYAAVIYSCSEVDIYKEVGLFALLEGPENAPRLLLRPRGLTILVYDDSETTVQWRGNRFCCVTSYGLKPGWSGEMRVYSGLMVFDLERRKVAYLPGASSGSLTAGLPESLAWKSWLRLSFWPALWRQTAMC